MLTDDAHTEDTWRVSMHVESCLLSLTSHQLGRHARTRTCKSTDGSTLGSCLTIVANLPCMPYSGSRKLIKNFVRQPVLSLLRPLANFQKRSNPLVRGIRSDTKKEARIRLAYQFGLSFLITIRRFFQKRIYTIRIHQN